MAEERKNLLRGVSGQTSAEGMRYPKMGAFRDDPITQSITAKLVENTLQSTRYDMRGNLTEATPSGNLVWATTEKSANNLSDNRNMMQLLPDMELAQQVLISTILSPNDMMSCELTYISEDTLLGDATAAMTKCVSDYFKGVYRIDDLLPDILKDVLFYKGSYPIAIIPESSIDDAINSNDRVTMESVEVTSDFTKEGLPKHYGILGPKTAAVRRQTPLNSIGLEDYTARAKHYGENYDRNVGFESWGLVVTDNPNVLKHPMLRDKVIQDRLNDVYAIRQVGMESKTPQPATDSKLKQDLYRPRQYKNVPVLSLKTMDQLERPSVGHPLVMNLPAESLIPVHTPSNPDEHVGYFVLLDQTGSPLSKAYLSDYYADLTSSVTQNKEMQSQLLSVTQRATAGYKRDSIVDVGDATKLYMDVVEKDLMSRLRNGIYGDNVKIARPTEVYQIMLARACQKMYTQLLYIPVELMTYIAFDFNKYGVGKSLLEDTKILGGIRAIMLFANTMAAIKNSTNHISLDIELDPKDPDPAHTVEMLTHEYAKTRQANYPLGASNPLDIVNFLQMAGVETAVSGHPRYPTTKMSVNDKTSNRAKPDTELEESLKKRHLFAIGVPPEAVDLSMNVDFASSVVQSNILMAKRAMIHQRKLVYFITDFSRKYIMNSSILMDKLRQIVKDNETSLKKFIDNPRVGVDGVVNHFIRTLEVSLPEPDMTQLKIQVEAFKEYSEGLEMVLPQVISTDMFDPAIMGELGGSVDIAVKILKAYFLRKWLRDNNVMPEVFEIMNVSETDGKMFNLLDKHAEHMQVLQKTLMGFISKTKKSMDKFNKLIEAQGGAPVASTPVDNSGGGGDDTDAGGGDDFGDLPDFEEDSGAAGGDEEPPAEGEKETPPAEEAKPADDKVNPPEDKTKDEGKTE